MNFVLSSFGYMSKSDTSVADKYHTIATLVNQPLINRYLTPSEIKVRLEPFLLFAVDTQIYNITSPDVLFKFELLIIPNSTLNQYLRLSPDISIDIKEHIYDNLTEAIKDITYLGFKFVVVFETINEFKYAGIKITF